MLNNDNCVIFKGRKDGILVLLDPNTDFEQLKETMKNKIISARKFFANAKAAITFKGRILSREEESELLNIVCSETNLNITFVQVDASGMLNAAASDSVTAGNTVSADSADNPSNVKNNVVERNSAANSTTYFHNGSLRSGQSIHYRGSVVVLGDVNPGGEIIAEGNVIILGTLKGLVHAGSTGNAGAYVSALKMSPAQLRIADTITYMPDDRAEKESKIFHGFPPRLRKSDPVQNKPPSYAYLHEGQIYIAPLINL